MVLWQEYWKRRYWGSEIVLTTIAMVITIVSRTEFLLFKVLCLIGFEKAITPINHEISKPASNSGYTNPG